MWLLRPIRRQRNKELVLKAIDEIIDVHDRYKNFSHYTQEQAKVYKGNNM